MRIGIYSPYLDSLGGGERYMLTIAEALSLDSKVDILLDTHLSILDANLLKSNLSKRFNLDLTSVNFLNAPLGRGSNFLSRILFLKKYDLIIALTDGSIFFSSAKRNFLHIQTPVHVDNSSIWRKLKLSSWDLIIYNSSFTKKHASSMWPLKSIVTYPPVDVNNIKAGRKSKKILSVGRFFGYLEDKKHSVMIDVFRDLCEKKDLEGWSLNLAGSALEGDMSYVSKLKRQAANLNVKIYPNIAYVDLIKLYGQSSIYWHASGFGETDPSKMEHFGITTVEAMAAGCVPVVIGLGGQIEIVEDGKSGFIWNSLDELKEKTLKLMNNSKLMDSFAKQAKLKSQEFSKERFVEEVSKIVYGEKSN